MEIAEALAARGLAVGPEEGRPWCERTAEFAVDSAAGCPTRLPSLSTMLWERVPPALPVRPPPSAPAPHPRRSPRGSPTCFLSTTGSLDAPRSPPSAPRPLGPSEGLTAPGHSPRAPRALTPQERSTVPGQGGGRQDRKQGRGQTPPSLGEAPGSCHMMRLLEPVGGSVVFGPQPGLRPRNGLMAQCQAKYPPAKNSSRLPHAFAPSPGISVCGAAPPPPFAPRGD